MTALCNGCRALQLETWPKGVTVARCFSDRAPAGTIDHRGRVLELYSPEAHIEAGPLPRIQRPAWCPQNQTETGDRDGKTEKPTLLKTCLDY